MRRAALLLALGARAWAAPAPSPLDVMAREQALQGYQLKERVERRIAGKRVAVAVYGAKEGSGDRLEAYVVVGDKAFLGFSHPGRADRIEIDPTPAGRGFRDLLGDGSRLIGYHVFIRALNAGSLELLRYKDFRFELLREFPEGGFVQDGAETVVLARDLPLGRFLSLGCGQAGTISQTAFRTRLYAPERGAFVEVTKQHPRFFASEIARKEAALARLRGDLEKNAGEYLGLALSLYYDYSARGEPRRGWDRQRDFFRLPDGSSAPVRACFESMRKDLRARLGVPADWP